MVRYVKVREAITVLAERPFAWALDRSYRLGLTLQSNRITAAIDGQLVAAVFVDGEPFTGGGVALIVTEGTLASRPVPVKPIDGTT